METTELGEGAPLAARPDPAAGAHLADVQLALALLVLLQAGFLAHGLWTHEQPGPPPAVALPYRVHLNDAPVGELRAIPGIGAVLAQRIADERRRAPFATVADLERVHGIGPVLLHRIRPHVLVEAD